jgi:5'-phosphate synthase pdxT subunit
MKVGVISVQGDVSEHVASLDNAFQSSGISGSAHAVKTPDELQPMDAIVLPGGESTAISKLLLKSGLFEAIKERGEHGMPIMGTCSGCVLMASELAGSGAGGKSARPDLLRLMDIGVSRNAFGRQRESFEANLAIEGLDKPFHAVFIRGPVIKRTWGRCKELARVNEGGVFARQGHLFAIAFHPELTDDYRIHELFLKCL